MADLILRDVDFSGMDSSIDKALSSYCAFLSDAVKTYIGIIDAFEAKGQTADAVQSMKGKVKGIDEKLAEIGKEMGSLSSSFISEVDKADSFIYE
jgi:phage-related minor tail protein